MVVILVRHAQSPFDVAGFAIVPEQTLVFFRLVGGTVHGRVDCTKIIKRHNVLVFGHNSGLRRLGFRVFFVPPP